MMFYKHWKKLALALTALFWSGCSDNSSSSKEQVACSLSGACPEYGVGVYVCDNPEDYDSENIDEKCTYYAGEPCTNYYSCDDGVTCRGSENEHVLDCEDKQEKSFSLTESEFMSRYYVKDE